MNKNKYIYKSLEFFTRKLNDFLEGTQNDNEYYFEAAKIFDNNKNPIILVHYPDDSMLAYTLPYDKEIVKEENSFTELVDYMHLSNFFNIILDDINEYESDGNIHTNDNEMNELEENDDISIFDEDEDEYEDEEWDNDNEIESDEENEDNTSVTEDNTPRLYHDDDYYEDFDTDYFGEFKNAVEDWIHDAQIIENLSVNMNSFDMDELFDEYQENDDSFLDTMKNNIELLPFTETLEENINTSPEINSEDTQEENRTESMNSENQKYHNDEYYEDYDTDYEEEFTETAKEWIHDYLLDHPDSMIYVDDIDFEDLNYKYQYNDDSFKRTLENNISKYIRYHSVEYYNSNANIDISNYSQFLNLAKEWVHDNISKLNIEDEEDYDDIDFNDIYYDYRENDESSFEYIMLSSLDSQGFLKDNVDYGNNNSNTSEIISEHENTSEGIEAHSERFTQMDIPATELYDKIRKYNEYLTYAEDWNNIKDKIYASVTLSNGTSNGDNSIYLENYFNPDETSDIKNLKETYSIQVEDNLGLKVTKSLFNKWNISEETLKNQVILNMNDSLSMSNSRRIDEGDFIFKIKNEISDSFDLAYLNSDYIKDTITHINNKHSILINNDGDIYLILLNRNNYIDNNYNDKDLDIEKIVKKGLSLYNKELKDNSFIFYHKCNSEKGWSEYLYNKESNHELDTEENDSISLD